MKREAEDTSSEPHVFDQTNGLVDLGEDSPGRPETGSSGARNRVIGGIAMLSANRPAG